MTRVLSTLVALVAALALPLPAMAQETNAPPGNSAIDEYLETVPGATGNQRPRQPGTGPAVLTKAERARLERLGPDGKTLADAVDATAPAPTRGKGSTPEIAPLTGEGRSPIAGVADAITGRDGGDGMGIVLPLILLASLLGTIALVLLRRRSVS